MHGDLDYMQQLRGRIDPGFNPQVWMSGSYSICNKNDPESKVILTLPEEVAATQENAPVIPISSSPSTSSRSFYWGEDETRFLIAVCKDQGENLTDPALKKNKVWQEIAHAMSSKFSIELSATKCGSRWTYLVKKYKQYLANKKQSGAARKTFEYAEEMEVALKDRIDISPLVLVGNNIEVNAPLKRKSSSPSSDSEEPPTKNKKKSKST